MKFLFLLPLLFFIQFIGYSQSNHQPFKKEVIYLQDNEVFPLNKRRSYDDDDISNRIYDAPYNWEIELDTTSNYNNYSNPIILRIFDSKENSFKNFKEELISNFNNTSLPIYYERAGLNRDYGFSYGFTDFFKKVMSESKVRREIFTYFLNYFKANEKRFPKSIKLYAIYILDNSLKFLSLFDNKSKYYSDLDSSFGNKPGFAERIGWYNSFLYRRIAYNKIPISELVAYIKMSIEEINFSMSDNKFSNAKDVLINNGQIVISDKKISGDGIDIVVWSKYNNKSLEFNKFSRIKFLKENEKEYYLIEHDFNETLVDTGLHIIYNRKLDRPKRDTLFSNVMNIKVVPPEDLYLFDIEERSQNGNVNKLKITEKNGVYYLPAKINEIPLEFIFDTGASTISISLTEAIFLLKNGGLKESDIKGSQYYKDANGYISEGTKINIRKITIGNKELLNVEASVVHNLDAPLLIGLSALKKLGKISLDTENGILSFD